MTKPLEITIRVDQSLVDKVRSDVEGERIARDFDRRLRRKHCENPVISTKMGALRKGHFIVATDDGMLFYRKSVVTSVDWDEFDGNKARSDEHLFISYEDLEGGHGTMQRHVDEQVLVEI